MRLLRYTGVLLAVLIATAAGPGPAASASGGAAAFTVTGGPAGPVPLVPGGTVTLDFTVTNTSSTAQRIDVKVTGLYFSGDTPEFTGSPSPGLTAGVTPQTMSLAPGSGHDVKVTLNVSPAARPGGLYAGVVFEDVPVAQSGGVNVVTAQARPLIGHVPGPVVDSGRIQSFNELGSSSGSSIRLQASFLDTGTIDYEISGSVTVLGSSGVVGTAQVDPRLVLPGNARTFPITVSPASAGGPLPKGPYTGILQLKWGVSSEHSGRATTPVQFTLSGVPNGGGGTAGQGTLPPTFIGRPLTHLPQHHPAARSTHKRTSAWTWTWRALDVLLLLLALILLAIAMWSWEKERRRRRDEARAGAGI